MGKSLANQFAFWKKSSAKTEIGVYLSETRLCVFCPATATEPEKYQTFELQNNDWHDAFAQVAKHCPASKMHITLAASLYQVILADKPAVDDAEIPQALLWAVKDLVSVPVANIHLDYFASPIASIAKINVVVVDKTMMQSIAAAAEQHDLLIAGVSIEELILSNLTREDEASRMLICHLPEQELLLTVIRQGELYMQRRIRGFNQVDKSSADELSYGSADNLSLEIQRSMDYYESQLRQPPVNEIQILMEGEAAALAQLVAVNFNQTVCALDKTSVAERIAQLSFGEFAREAV
ncbi:MSHA biogenesis protein MshI [Shewanella gelidii]|uniref:MSHA biogenesis protein MshI1 n=1 Tax=Shewanella gelidii TaxID=1642821 RepID=A0A917JW49_9GAMM|nr:MSHA biogenesis protein MshI [Shewanella gelidii]MCL1098745.1 MSHA biogenesis protein MshI [Shewanella gelidii]GGI87919.1 MSHA biogenesis protein MshI1 [Shewanella gelidii]